MVVGGSAVHIHGYERVSMDADMQPAGKTDIDIWYRPTYPNINRVLKALKESGVDVSRFEEEEMPNPKRSFFKLNFDFCTLDLLSGIRSSVRFQEAFERRDNVSILGMSIDVISYADLLADKAQMARAKDLIDIAALRKIQEDGKKQ